MISREYFKIAEKELERKQITALVGARQVGKTTILKETYNKVKKEAVFLSFDDREILKIFEENIKLFVEQYIEPNKYIFIDEFQYAKEGGKQLKFIYDLHYKKIFISGSSSPNLAIRSLQYLVGRVNIIKVYPLTFEEFVSYKSPQKQVLLSKVRDNNSLEQLKEEFEEYLTYGGYPEVVIQKNKEEKENLLKNIVQTYLLKEIKDVLDYKNVHEYETVITRLALQDGKLLNKLNISKQTGINRVKLDQMLNTLQQTFILQSVHPFLKNPVTTQRKSPKTYFEDLGIKNSLIKNFNSLELRTDKGEILENFVFNTLRRKEKQALFWNIENTHEIDFVIEEQGKITGIEIKSLLTGTNISKSTKKFLKEIKPNKVYILNLNQEGKKGTIEFSNIINIGAIIR